MAVTPRKLNLFTLFKLPSAYLCGVRLRFISEEKAKVTVKYRWINQNPFKSMYFAVQSMAAELSTGALVISKIQESGKRVSMLVVEQSASFSKKARGRIIFSCIDGKLIDFALEKAITTGEGQTFTLKSKGVDEKGDEVSSYSFKWSIKVKG